MNHNPILGDVQDSSPYVELVNDVDPAPANTHPHNVTNSHLPTQTENLSNNNNNTNDELAQLQSLSLSNQAHSSMTTDGSDHHRQPRQQQLQPHHHTMDYTTRSSFSSSKGQFNPNGHDNNNNDMNDFVEALTPSEISQLRMLLLRSDLQQCHSLTNHSVKTGGGGSMDSDYPEFGESTHAWAIFADHPQKRAGPWERVVGTIIIIFQLFAYRLFAMEAVEDFQKGQVPITTSHFNCLQMDFEPNDNFQCEAEFTNTFDALVAFFMLGIFLTGDMLQAGRAIRNAPSGGMARFFACIAGIEVVCAFLAASVAVSYHLFIGEVTDAVEVGVGLLFIRELSQQTYRGIRYGKTKQFRDFFLMLAGLVMVGLILDPLTAKVFAGYIQ